MGILHSKLIPNMKFKNNLNGQKQPPMIFIEMRKKLGFRKDFEAIFKNCSPI